MTQQEAPEASSWALRAEARGYVCPSVPCLYLTTGVTYTLNRRNSKWKFYLTFGRSVLDSLWFSTAFASSEISKGLKGLKDE